jgi:phosphohistidine swiveling domain-containing protein
MSGQAWVTDTAPSARYPIYTRLNANDVMPDPITPLGATMLWIPNILPGWADGYVAGDAFTPAELAGEEVAPVAGFFYGHLYINQTVVRISGIRMGLGWEAIDAAYFRVDSPPHTPRPEDSNAAASARMAARTNWTLTTTSFPELDEDRIIADRCRSERPDLGVMSAAALVARARSVMPLERLVWRGEVVASNQAAVGPGVIGQLLGAVDPSIIVQLIGSAGDVDSAVPSYALWDLARTVRTDAGLTAEFDAGLDGLVSRLTKHPVFEALFWTFIRDFGYRGPSEWDLGAESWETKPELALALVERLRKADDSRAPERGHERAAIATASAHERALALLDSSAAKEQLELAIASARRFGAWRERGKTNCIKVINEARVALAELGRRLHADGHLSRPQQIFMALDRELEILVMDPSSLRATLVEREERWDELSSVELPVFVDSSVPMIPLAELPRQRESQVHPVVDGEVLHGAGCSAGVARGRTRVVTDPGAIVDFEPGEILIAPQTDPSWTPMFIVAAAVVIDVGAIGSHAMIVSRELGIPCVAGVSAATRRVPDGTLVQVDGSTGTLTVLSVEGLRPEE